VVELLLAAGANPRAKGPSGAPPMHMAALEGKTDVVLLFLAKGVDINLPRRRPRARSIYGRHGGHTELVKAPPRPQGRGDRARPARRGAARRCTTPPAAGTWRPWSCCSRAASPLNAREFGETAFQVAADAGQVESLKLLLSKGAKVDYTPPQYGNETALHLATHQGHLAAVTFLIDSGANVNAVDAHSGARRCTRSRPRRTSTGSAGDRGAPPRQGREDRRQGYAGQDAAGPGRRDRNDDAVKLLRERGAKE
jgi:ankyrin repeat protein